MRSLSIRGQLAASSGQFANPLSWLNPSVEMAAAATTSRRPDQLCTVLMAAVAANRTASNNQVCATCNDVDNVRT